MIKHNTLALFCGVALFFSGMQSMPAQNLKNAAKDTRYLALGDSLAFGLNPFINPPNLSKYIGYPVLASKALGEKVANASCPGETSGTFAGTSSIFLPGFDCGPLRAGGLFVPYNGAATQLDYAFKYLASNPNPKLVTLNLGVNDLGVLLADCTAASGGDPGLLANCELGGLTGVLNTYGQNLGLIFSTLRGSGYTGPIVFLNAFAFNYNDPLQVGAITALNQVLLGVAPSFHVTVADAYRTFQVASKPFGGDPCRAGLLLKDKTGVCDTHPSAIGQALLAATVVTAVEGLPKTK